jgi:endonuclease YncB( thermonuclease family)
VARAIEQLRSGQIVGHAKLGRRGQGRGSVAQQVHDGDTVTVEGNGNLGVRFLGVDAPEVSVPLPGTKLPFVDLDDPRWEQVLTDPFSPDLDPFEPLLDGALEQHLREQTGADAAGNHARLADAATKALEGLAEQDRTELDRTVEDFAFFLAFAGEVMDRYGRLLGFLHPDQPKTPAAERRRSYNERLLAAGWVSPYFIWPNVNPFRRAPAITAAVPAPRTANQLAEQDGSLRAARESVRQARDAGHGLYDKDDSLQLLPFELRFVARRQPPDRWVIDLNRGDDVLIPPQAYFEIANPEDRLFVPAEYVPLFVERGWRRG